MKPMSKMLKQLQYLISTTNRKNIRKILKEHQTKALNSDEDNLKFLEIIKLFIHNYQKNSLVPSIKTSLIDDNNHLGLMGAISKCLVELDQLTKSNGTIDNEQ